jgi:hypothetical protein
MISPILDFFEKLITEFTWKRLAFVIIAISFILGGVFAYETYTGHFRLNKIDRATKLLAELADLSPKIKNNENNVLTNTYIGIENDLDNFVNHRTTPFSIPKWLLKFLAASMPWTISSFIFLLGDGESKHAIMGMLFAAIPGSIIGAMLHDFKYQPINYVFYPLASYIVLSAMAVTYGKIRRKKKVPATTNYR